MACCQHTIQQRSPETMSPLMGRMATSRRQLLSAKDCFWEKGKEGTPHRSVREAEMVTQTVGSTQACVRLASMWESLGKCSVPSPPTPAHTQTHCCPAWSTWYISSGIWPRWLLAALTPGSCASSLPVGRLGTATSSTTCGSSRVKRQTMNYCEAAAANLTFIQEIHCKHMTAHVKHMSTCHPHANAWLITWLVFCAKGFVWTHVTTWFIWGHWGRMLYDDFMCCIYVRHKRFHQASAHLFVWGNSVERSNQKAAKDYTLRDFLPFQWWINGWLTFHFYNYCLTMLCKWRLWQLRTFPWSSLGRF